MVVHSCIVVRFLFNPHRQKELADIEAITLLDVEMRIIGGRGLMEAHVRESCVSVLSPWFSHVIFFLYVKFQVLSRKIILWSYLSFLSTFVCR